MPTTIYTKQPIASVSHLGKSYTVKEGAVDVPDDAVDVLCESHGFTTKAPEQSAESEEEEPLDLATLTKNQLISLNIEEKLGAELKNNMTKDEVLALVKPLWEAKQAE